MANIQGKVNRRSVRFPGTQEDIEILTVRNDDGSLKKVDVGFACVTKGYDDIMSIIHPKIPNHSEDLFNLVIDMSGQGISINVIRKTDGIVDYKNETPYVTLTEDEIKKFRSGVMVAVGRVLDLFEKYFQAASGQTVEQSNFNQSMAMVLRLTVGGRVRYLEDLFNWYLAIGGQSYFDIIASIVMSGSYTFPSLTTISFMVRKQSDTGLLRGNTFLKGALRKKVEDEHSPIRRGEYCLTSGLTVSFLRQSRIRLIRTLPTSATINDYDEVKIMDDNLLFGQSGFSSVATGHLSPAKMRNTGKAPVMRFCLPAGLHYVKAILKKFDELRFNVKVSTILGKRASSAPLSVLDVGQIFDLDELKKDISILDGAIDPVTTKTFLNNLPDIDEFQENFESVKLILGRLLCLCDVHRDSTGSEFYEEMTADNDVLKSLDSLVDEFASIMS